MARKTWSDVTIKAALIGAVILMYLDLRAEIRAVKTKIDQVENKFEGSIDKVETKIDVVRGYLKFNVSNQTENEAPAIPGKLSFGGKQTIMTTFATPAKTIFVTDPQTPSKSPSARAKRCRYSPPWSFVSLI